MNNQKKIRIVFRIDKNLLKELDLTAAKTGQSKSKLIRQWLNENRFSFQPNSYENSFKKTLSYCIFLNKRLIKKMDNETFRFGLTRSSFLRNLIYTKILSKKSFIKDPIQSPSKYHFLLELEKRGNLKRIEHELKKDIEKYTINEAIMAAKTFIEIGKIHKADQILQMLEKRVLNKEHVFQVKSMKVDISTYRSQFQMSHELCREILENSEGISKNLTGKVYLQLAELIYVNAQNLEDILHLEKYIAAGLSYLDRFSHPILVAEHFLLLATTNSYKGKKEINSFFLKESKNLIHKSSNTYYKGWYYNEESMSKIADENLAEALKSINKAINFHEQSGSLMKLFYAYGIKARILFLMKKDDESFSFMQKSLVLKNYIKIDSPFSSIDFFKLLFESKHNYSRSVEIYENAIKKLSRTTPEREYDLAAMRYLNGKDPHEIEKGKVALKRIIQEASMLRIKVAAEKTLNSGVYVSAR